MASIIRAEINLASRTMGTVGALGNRLRPGAFTAPSIALAQACARQDINIGIERSGLFVPNGDDKISVCGSAAAGSMLSRAGVSNLFLGADSAPFDIHRTMYTLATRNPISAQRTLLGIADIGIEVSEGIKMPFTWGEFYASKDPFYFDSSRCVPLGCGMFFLTIPIGAGLSQSLSRYIGDNNSLLLGFAFMLSPIILAPLIHYLSSYGIWAIKPILNLPKDAYQDYLLLKRFVETISPFSGSQIGRISTILTTSNLDRNPLLLDAYYAALTQSRIEELFSHQSTVGARQSVRSASLLSRHESTDAKTLDQIVESLGEDVPYEIVDHPNITREGLIAIALLKNDIAQRAYGVLCEDGLTEDDIAILAGSKNLGVLSSLTKRPDIRDRALAICLHTVRNILEPEYSSKYSAVRSALGTETLENIANHPNASTDTLITLALGSELSARAVFNRLVETSVSRKVLLQLTLRCSFHDQAEFAYEKLNRDFELTPEELDQISKKHPSLIVNNPRVSTKSLITLLSGACGERALETLLSRDLSEEECRIILTLIHPKINTVFRSSHLYQLERWKSIYEVPPQLLKLMQLPSTAPQDIASYIALNTQRSKTIIDVPAQTHETEYEDTNSLGPIRCVSTVIDKEAETHREYGDSDIEFASSLVNSLTAEKRAKVVDALYRINFELAELLSLD